MQNNTTQMITGDTESRLKEAANIWIATVRQGGRPHLVPVWFVLTDDSFWMCIAPDSVKAKNIMLNPAVVLALEDGSAPVICEGSASVYQEPWPVEVTNLFLQKYDWDILTDNEYTVLVKVVPSKLLSW